MQQKTEFDALSRGHGFAAIYPNGRGRNWNDGSRRGGRVNDAGYWRPDLKGCHHTRAQIVDLCCVVPADQEISNTVFDPTDSG